MKKVLFLGTLLCAMSFGLFAQDNEQKDEAIARSQDVMNIKLGNELAKHGYATQSTISLLEAARILDGVQTRALEAERTTQGGQASSGDRKEAIGFNPETLIADAKRYAGNDQHLLALVADVESAIKASHGTNRGSTIGPTTKVDVVSARTTDVYQVSFYGGQTAECAVIGDGDTDLDLYIYDENGNLIVKDDDYTDNCYVRWTPRWTGKFTIKIKNRGNISNRYVIAVN